MDLGTKPDCTLTANETQVKREMVFWKSIVAKYRCINDRPAYQEIKKVEKKGNRKYMCLLSRCNRDGVGPLSVGNVTFIYQHIR